MVAPPALLSSLGYGKGYEYPHDAEAGVVATENLPEKIAGARLYAPRESGYEKTIGERVRWFEERRKGK